MNPAYPFRRFFLAALALMLSFGMALAGPGATKAKNKLASQIRGLVSSPDSPALLSGEAIVFFTVDEEQFIHVKGIFGTNDDLIQHIEESLKDHRVDLKGIETNEEFQVKLKFNDLR